MSFNIKISNGKGNIQNLSVKKTDTISNAKIAAGYTPTTNYKWKSDGQVLKDEKTIDFYNIEEDDLIVVSRNQIGGEFYK
jgi:hypothetical protein